MLLTKDETFIVGLNFRIFFNFLPFKNYLIFSYKRKYFLSKKSLTFVNYFGKLKKTSLTHIYLLFNKIKYKREAAR